MDLHVGDVIRVPDDANIPCDMVILSSSNSDGCCYITSANLDGETNLKVSSQLHGARLVVHR
jgi:P-type E1-E2 ATPase